MRVGGEDWRIIPSGELTFCNGKSPFLMENPLFLWPFSIAMLVHQRVYNYDISHDGSMVLEYLPTVKDSVSHPWT